MIAIHLSKQLSDPKARPKINFTRDLNRNENGNDNTVIFFIIEEAKETILDFSQETVKVLLFYFVLI